MPESTAMATADVLTDVLQTVRVGAACYGRLEATAPWGIEASAADDAKFHVVLNGECWLSVEGFGAPMRLSSGDLVALPHGHAHSLRDALETEAHSLESIVACKLCGDHRPLRIGGGGAETTLVSGRFHFEDRKNNPLLAVLPPVITLAGKTSQTIHWLEPTLKFIACEAASDRPGAQTVISRLADVLFIQIVRGHLANLPANSAGWLGALTDPQIGAALGAIHQNPEQDWTVQSLAAKVAMSRSAFASRFTRLVGEPPLQYITRWRMQKAAGLLREGKATLGEIAQRVGYDSEAAFSKAFKRAVGTAPGAYRRAARVPGLSAAA